MRYDEAHALARELKASQEFTALLAAQKALEEDPSAVSMVKDFVAKQMELEFIAMSGKDDTAKTEALHKLYDLIMANSKAKEYLQAHMIFQQMMNDIYKIIGESVAEGMNMFAK